MSKRAANFAAEEVDLLIDLVKSKQHIIECKKSNHLLWKKKDAMWERIAQEFNMRYGKIYRSAGVLRKKYENLKKSTKQKFADQKANALGTGGGPAANINITPVEEEIKDILGVRLEGLPSYLDSDADRDTCEVIIIQGENENTESWRDYTPASLTQPISNPLRNSSIIKKQKAKEEAGPSTSHEVEQNGVGEPAPKSRKVTGRTTNEKWCSLADKKKEFLKLQEQLLIEEHQTKMELLHMEKVLKEKQIEEQEYKNRLLLLGIKIKEKSL